MSILAGVVALFAILALALAVREAMAIARLSPKASGLGNYFVLGWWKFGAIATQADPDAAPHLEIYKRAVIAFLVFVVIGLVLSGIASGFGRS
ncbi:hypothetical protein [uncultured Devosia sp.]|uniref:hypothetical protein n=1 Tax=uncultured Devosia sp. TaxID=211434 RepID=UPI0035CAD57D